MFTPDALIDTVQNSKKQFVETFVTDKAIKQGLVEVINAQTEFAKTLAKNSIAFTELYVKSFPVATK